MAILLVILLVVLFLLNLPIAFAIGLATVTIVSISGDIDLIRLPQSMFASLNSFPLLAAPLFILAGSLMEQGGISQKLVNFAESMVGNVRGGMAYVGIIACMFFAAISGSAIATIIAIGAIMIPAMVKKGYDRRFSTSLIAAAGTTGPIIPPSIPMVVYGVLAEVSVGKMFLAGIVPGLLVGFSLMGVSYIIVRKNDYGTMEKKSWKELWLSFKDAIWAMLMPIIILGGIYSGIFTPTESAAIAVVYGFLVGVFIYKQITFTVLKKILFSTVITSSTIGLIMATASFFSIWLTLERVPHVIAETLQSANFSPLLTILLINLFLLFLGTLMESNAAMLISTPILVPIAISIGMDPIHFGIVMLLNLTIGILTPPVGMGLFVASKIGNVNFESLIKPSLPFIFILIIDLLIITLFPQLSIGFANLF